MNLSTAGRTVQLLKRICDIRTATQPFVPPTGEKPSLPLRSSRQPFERVTPESQGISSHHIRNFLAELGQGGDLYMQTVLILRNEKLLCAAAYGAQTLDAAKYTFSACKSITSLAIGLLIDDGLLRTDTPVTQLLSDCLTPAASRRLRDLTVEDLLTMRSGIMFTEVQTTTESDWLRCILSDTLSQEPGTQFRYNSMNTYLLSVIVCRITGESLSSFLQRRLFEPMGITDTLWECSADGFEKGGWGLYIRPEDAAKLGQLVLNGGVWKNERLISHEYLEAATAHHVSPSPVLGDFDYGYQIWVGRQENTFLFNGMLGQNVMGFRDSGILIVTNAGADTDYQQSRFFEIVSRFFGGVFPETVPENPQAHQQLTEFIRTLSYYERDAVPLSPAVDPFFDRRFVTSDPRAASTGLFPLLLQILHNSYTTGFASLSLSRRGNLPELIYREHDATHRLTVGLGKPHLTELNFCGNIYRVAAHGHFTHDEEERPVFYIRLDFLETPSVRILKLILTGEGMILRQNETPGGPYIFEKLRTAAHQPLIRPLLHISVGSSEEDYLSYKVKQLIAPELHMTAESYPLSSDR